MIQRMSHVTCVNSLMKRQMRDGHNQLIYLSFLQIKSNNRSIFK